MAEAASVRVGNRSHSPAYQAYQILRVGFSIALFIAGLDKFFHVLVDWDIYLAPVVPGVLGVSAHTFMLAVGVIEIVVAFVVAVAPRVGGWIVGVWLCGIVVNLLIVGSYFDIALRDFSLAMGAFALARLGAEYGEI